MNELETKSIIEKIFEFFSNPVIAFSEDLNISVMTVIQLFVLLGITMLALYGKRKMIYHSPHLNTGKKYSVNNLVRYVIIAIAALFALEIMGIDIKVLLAGSAALLVGVGLGLQNLFSDFVSGIILLIDNSIKVGDVVDVNGLVCEVKEINLRTTLVLTRDDKFILLPNTFLTKNKLINWSHTVEASRFKIEVGVDYDSDVAQVMSIMKEVAEQEPEVAKNPEPFVRFNDYGDSSLNFTVYFWCSQLFRVENIKSSIRVKLFEAFKQSNITIPFPQRVLHTVSDDSQKDSSSKNKCQSENRNN